MSQVSVLMPAWRFKNVDQFNDYLYNNYQTTPENVEYYELTPVAPEKMNKVSNFAIKFKTSDFNLINVENILQENRQLNIQAEKFKETIKTLSSEYNKVFVNSNLIKDVDQQKALRRAKKIKQLDDDNKKLRQLLRSQLENSEKLRIETQATIETLKEEFELLVKELGNMQKKNTESIHSGGQGSGGSGSGSGQNSQFYGSHSFRGNNLGNLLYDTKKSNDIIPKLDKIEMLLNDQQNATIQVDEQLNKN